MSDLTLSPELLRATPTPLAPAGPMAAEQARQVAEEFESAFLAIMLQPMFASLSTEAPFGGGSGEAAFRSFMVEEMAKGAARAGGVGLADTVARELLKMQGLTEDPATEVPTPQQGAA